MALRRIGNPDRKPLVDAALRKFLILSRDRAIAGVRRTAVADAFHVDIGQVIGLIDVPQLVNMLNRLAVRPVERITGPDRHKLAMACRGVAVAVSKMNSLNGNHLVRSENDGRRTAGNIERPKGWPTNGPRELVVRLHATDGGNARIGDPAPCRRDADGDGIGARQPGTVVHAGSGPARRTGRSGGGNMKRDPVAT